MKITLKINLTIIFGFWAGTIIHSQTHVGLNLSDKMPPVTFTNFLDSPNQKVQSSYLLGKLVILDFWNVHCSSCIADMPRLDSLQDEFGNSIKIIMVTENSANEVKELFSKIKISKPNLSILTSDTILRSLFPHIGDPFHVWIDKFGEVAAITYNYYTNRNSIRSALSGQPIKLPRRWDYDVNPDFPLLSEKNLFFLDHSSYHSVLFKNTNELTVSKMRVIRYDSTFFQPYLIQLVNIPLLELYEIAYNSTIYGFVTNLFDLHTNNRIILKVKNGTPFTRPKDKNDLGNWISKNLYSYELGIDSEKQQDIFQFMREDLARLFDYKAVIEKRKTRCLELVRTSNIDKIHSQGKKSGRGTIKVTNKQLVIKQMPLKESLLKRLVYANYYLDMPIIDRTNYEGDIDLILNCSLTDIISLRIELKKYDLDLIETDDYVDYLSIYDK